MNGLKHIISKELSRVFKDRKLVFSLFILPLFIVVGLFTLIGKLVESKVSDIEAHLPVAYVVDAPEAYKQFAALAGLEDIYLMSGDADYSSKFEGFMDELKNAVTDIVIVFPEGFENEVMKGINDAETFAVPDIQVYYNPSEDYSSQANEVYKSILESYKQSLLSKRFGDFNSIVMFNTVDNVVQDDEKAAGKMLGMMLPYFITMLIFATSMGLGIDMITGEKERGTMATMLLTPVNRTSIVLGKVISLSILAVLSAVVYIVAMCLAVPVMMGSLGADDISGLSLSFSAAQIIEIVVLMIGVVLLYVSIICFVAVISKNTKEASSYISPVYMIVIVAGMITMYASADGELVKYLIPIYGSSAAFKDILTQEILLPNFLAATISTYVLAGILVAAMTKAFNSEKVMFNA